MKKIDGAGAAGKWHGSATLNSTILSCLLGKINILIPNVRCAECIRVGLEECSLVAESIESLARDAGKQKRPFTSPAQEVRH